MPVEHVSVLQSMGAAILLLAAGVWVFVLVNLARRGYFGPLLGPTGRPPRTRAVSRRRRSAPLLESVELTPAEKDAFAGLVRRLSDGG